MIAECGRDNPGHFCPRALQIVHVDNAAAHLEGRRHVAGSPVVRHRSTPSPSGRNICRHKIDLEMIDDTFKALLRSGDGG